MSEGHLSTAARLKQRTADSHRRVEQRLDLLDARTPDRMLSALSSLYGFWAAHEPAVDRWFAAHPAAAEALQWPRRARLDLLRHDVDTLATACGVDVPPVAPAPVAADTTGVVTTGVVTGGVDEAAVLGWLYVAEGSTLGGAMIDRALRGAGFPVPLVSFTPYAEGPGPMWLAYLAHLESWTAGDEPRADLVVAAGVQAFGALENWLLAQGSEAAA